jgi:beta-glucosidase-like glycosyl hydrolase
VAADRIETLIAQMTVEEKVGQLGVFADMVRPFAPDVNPEANVLNADQVLQQVREGKVGSLFNGVGVEAGRRIQQVALEESRLKIPVILAADVIHGMRTVFPIPLGEAASFEPDLAERTARATAVEATAAGLHWTYAPAVDIARDQRWGRGAEGAGEDVVLGCAFAAARVRGFQGSDLRAADSLLATPKHFAAYGAVMAGMEYNMVDISPQTLRDVDLSMQSGFYAEHLPGLVESGEVPMSVLDEGVRRILWLKEAIGLFDDPYRSLDPAREADTSHIDAHDELSRDAARRSIVLLNNRDNVLPLQKNGQKIALIGPFVQDRDNIEGCWTLFGDKQRYVDLETGVRAAIGDDALLEVVPGCELEAAIAGGTEAAVAAALRADVVVLALGEPQRYSGEAQSRVEITLPPAQQALAEAVAMTGKPLVVLLRNGRALALQGAVRNAHAVAITWYLGTQTGHAVADVLFGDYSPSGRLPVSFPQVSGQQPYFYNHPRTGRPELPTMSEFKARWREIPNEPLYPFGHGIGYTTFAYGVPQLSTARVGWDDTLTVTTTLTNAGSVAGEEVVQLYIHDRVASRVRPVRELKDFRKVALQPGESAEVVFTLTREQLAFTGRDGVLRAEPGLFDVWVCASSMAGDAVQFELLKA